MRNVFGEVATAFCRHCICFICADCVKSHERMRVFADHKVSTLNELKQVDIVAKLIPPPICKVHDEKAKIYCYDCNSLICRDCVVKDHKEHEYEFVKKAAPEKKGQLMDHLVPLNGLQVSIINAITTIEESRADIDKMSRSMTETINRSFAQLRCILNKREKELLSEAANVVQQKTSRLDSQQKKLEMSSGIIQSLVDFVRKSMENSSDEELMTIHVQMMTRIKQETEKQRQATIDLDPAEENDRAVVIECALDLKKCCESASIVAMPTKVALEKVDKNVAIVDQTSHVSILLKFQDGRLAKRLCNLEAILTSTVDGSHLHTTVLWREEGAYRIEFTPTVRGRHHLQVVYNGAPVLGTPVEMFVTISPTKLGKPIKSIDIGDKPKFVAINSSEEILVTTKKRSHCV